MKKLLALSLSVLALGLLSFRPQMAGNEYLNYYFNAIYSFNDRQFILFDRLRSIDLSTEEGITEAKRNIELARLKLKEIDFWLRYLDPIAYKKINGPLPVEWETEVFEKFEKPYRREGAGLSLAELYLDEKNISRDTLVQLVQSSIDASKVYLADSVSSQLRTYHHFFLANRLFLLNLAAIYTTGFECPTPENIIPELRHMLTQVRLIYDSFNQSFPATPLTKEYIDKYGEMLGFVTRQSKDFTYFDHFTFIKDYVNPLFAINQKLIQSYKVRSYSFNDYSLNNTALSIFDKGLCTVQNTKGIYSLVEDQTELNEINRIGKLLFYDPILSGNNMRSCVSCHKPKQYFTDTTVQTGMQFNRKERLPRNTPSLVNAIYNHLLMLDGKHYTLQAQAKAVMTNPIELAGAEEEILDKVMSCKEYKDAFKNFVKLTPEENKVTLRHLISAITYYYGAFSEFYSPFDDAMNHGLPLDEKSKKGFNLFMSKAQCGTCHYVPLFNGAKPPFIESEFEVLGVPGDKGFKQLSTDSGRCDVHPVPEMLHAFRTGSLRNIEHTQPYMHNGVFSTLQEVIDFYDAGGGTGKKMKVENQTLSSDSLKLTSEEKDELISFLSSLNEKIIFEEPPAALPASSDEKLNSRKVGGEY